MGKVMLFIGPKGSNPSVPRDERLRVVKALRAALLSMERPSDEATLAAADAILTTMEDDGFAYVADFPDDFDFVARSVIATDLRDSGLRVAVEDDYERAARRLRSDAMTAEGATPEQVFEAVAPGEADAPAPEPEGDAEPAPDPELSGAAYQTALALLGGAQGIPLNAAVTAVSLGRTTGNYELYRDALACILVVFPWVHPALQRAGIA